MKGDNDGPATTPDGYTVDENGNYILTDYEENIEKYKTSNNLALLDVIQGLRWIKQNAAAFGGDVDNITIAGESAGRAAYPTC